MALEATKVPRSYREEGRRKLLLLSQHKRKLKGDLMSALKHLKVVASSCRIPLNTVYRGLGLNWSFAAGGSLIRCQEGFVHSKVFLTLS